MPKRRSRGARYEEVSKLNRELIKMVDFTAPFWNAGARYWLEHRGPALTRALANSPGLKLWLQSPPVADLDYVLKVSALLGDHVVVGHCGPLPPHHLALAFPWRVDESTEIPPPPPYSEPVVFPLRVDAVRRPLPPVAKQCLLGPIRTPIAEGVISYFPASIIYAPLFEAPWPDPAEVIGREGHLPVGHRLISVKRHEGEGDPSGGRSPASHETSDPGW